ncbi:MAG: discoidin domain-containing protein [Thermoanaerobaculia bacterium]|nr:discoidin domain-containing protein [Thermoanaerobaculia bacterium]
MRRIVLSFAILAACSRPAATPPVAAEATREDLKTIESERGNVLNMATGASVVSRTGEMTLDSSAVAAIDGESGTGWGAPPADIDQTIVFALPSMTRIENVGILTPRPDPLRINNLRLEASSDGTTFVKLAEPALTSSADSQMFPVTPVDAQFIRFTLTGAAGNFPSLLSLQVRGQFLSVVRPASIAGCWNVNGEAATFQENGGAISGRIGADVPIVLSGGAEAAVYRFTWVHGPDHGVAAMTVAPGAATMSGLRWYERAQATHTGGAWFGDKSPCGSVSKAAARDLPSTFLERAGRYPLYTLRFDEQDHIAAVDEISWNAITSALARNPSQKVSLVAREYRSESAETNARRARARIDSLRAALTTRGADLSRIELVAAGSDEALASPASELIRLMHSAVEISVK